MTLDVFMSQLKLFFMAAIAFLAGRGIFTPADATFATAAVTILGPMLIPALWSLWSRWNSKSVPAASVAIEVTPQAASGGFGVSPVKGDFTTIAGKVVGALLLGFLILQPAPSFAQVKPDANGNAANNSCDPTTIFKVVVATSFLSRLKTCNADDLKLAIDDASKQSPPDNAALACLMPLQTIVTGSQTGGIFLALQLFRDAKRAGVVPNCVNYVNSTLLP